MKRSLPVQTTSLGTWPALRRLLNVGAWMLVGALLIALMYQIPARHSLRVGVNDAAYVQGFSDPINRWDVIDPGSQAQQPLRWSRAQSYIIFPQIGLPATATLRWRALRNPGDPMPTVRVLLNGRDELGAFPATGAWETHTFSVTSGLFKANDVFLELRTEPPVTVDGDARGVQVDQAELTTSGWPIMPYPAQLAYGAVVVGLATTLTRRRSYQIATAGMIALVFLLGYRLQITPYPLRSLLPLLALGLAASVVVRGLPRVRTGRWAAAPGLIAVSLLALWLGWLLVTAQQHVTLSVPGVEKDFRVFATRAQALICDPAVDWSTASCVLRADGFYQLGYPLLLWLIKPLTQFNPFLAARLVGAVSSVVLLGATWLLGRRLLGGGAALLALAVLALSPLVMQYGLYVGTDMAFAALWMAGLTALLAPRRSTFWTALGAGILCGLAFLIRHPGLVLLPFGWLALWITGSRSQIAGHPVRPSAFDARRAAIFTLGWLLAAAPQISVNIAYAGAPLYNQQAKNIWLAVYGNTDWGRWSEASNTVALSDIVWADPLRFFGHWWRNLQVFIGTGAEDTSEFGQAIGLRLLAFPANWLALIGLGLWLWRGDRRQRLLVAGSALYVLGVSVGFLLPRFFLPVAPVWALASVTPVLWLASALARRWPRLDRVQWSATAGLALLALLARGPQIGARAVLAQQDKNAVALVQMLTPRLSAQDRILFALPAEDTLGKYSALAHRATQAEATARYVVWSSAMIDQPASVRNRAPLATFGPYALFALQ